MPSQRDKDEHKAKPDKARYHLERDEEGPYLSCCNAPNIKLIVQAGLVVDSSTRRKYPRQSIFLDGVYDGPPFLDNGARQYSLDHHAGCVRAFTLATCEQAAVMLLQGLPLGEGEWRLWVNEPDIDAILAAWVLFNHTELLLDDERYLRAAMPLIRLEGVIDAHGPELSQLTAFDAERELMLRAQLEILRAPERELKSAGEWFSADWRAHALATLEAIDRQVFSPDTIAELLELRELARVYLSESRIAVLCASNEGIYAVEQQLRARHGKQLAIIVLDAGHGRFTLRQLDPFIKKDLTALYRVLNARDPAVHDRRSSNRWGGSADIGGSPRRGGSKLSGREILDAVDEVFAPPRTVLGQVGQRLVDVAERSLLAELVSKGRSALPSLFERTRALSPSLLRRRDANANKDSSD
ncbi:MAG: hypothetical protein RBU37_19900 [Myxococcota bacterium]|jgi:hypothetical protein|nr:hypothetical protein [Myxococcota bacterium]